MKANGAWRLSGLVAERCSGSERLRACWSRARVRRTICRLAAWLELAGGFGVVGEGGHAVVCLTPPRYRDKLRFLGVAGAMVLAVSACLVVGIRLWWPLAIPAVVLWAMVMVPAMAFSWQCRAAGRALREVRPAGAWSLRNFAGDPRYPGAGRALLVAVCAEADRRGQVMYLDTSVRHLVDYYREFGFEVAVEAAMPADATWTVSRMIRPAARWE